MINFFIKKFIKDYDSFESPSVRAAYGKFSSFVGIFCNIILFIGKIIIGTLSGSVSITADAINSLSDASSSVISLLGFKLANKPADNEHPYGHGRYEYLSALVVSILIIVIGVDLFKSSIEKIITPSPVEFSWVSIGVLLFSIAIKLWLMIFNKKIGKKISSSTLLATAADSRNDIITTSAVLISSVISHFCSIELDGYMGLCIAIFILYSGFLIIKDTLDPVLGKAPEPEYTRKIQEKILSYPGVLGTHDLMVHDYGPGRKFASVHVEMAAEDDVIKSHDVIDNIEHDFYETEHLHLVIHFDPILTTNAETNDLRSWLANEIKIINETLTIHDLRIVPGTTHTNIIFDCVAPIEYCMTDAELKAAIRALVKKTYPTYNCVITIDRTYAPLPH